jgi:hypothetical protein
MVDMMALTEMLCHRTTVSLRRKNPTEALAVPTAVKAKDCATMRQYVAVAFSAGVKSSRP